MASPPNRAGGRFGKRRQITKAKAAAGEFRTAGRATTGEGEDCRCGHGATVLAGACSSIAPGLHQGVGKVREYDAAG